MELPASRAVAASPRWPSLARAQERPPESERPSAPAPRPAPDAGSEEPPRGRPPWRIEGMPSPPGEPKRPRFDWRRMALWLVVSYAIVFVVLTLQDQSSGPPTVSYTEFTAQVDARNVAEVFSRGDSIEGSLKAPAPLPDAPAGTTYTQFRTERPTFADDSLLARLQAGGAIVKATPVVQERGFFTNLLFSFGPLLLFAGVYVWFLRRQQQGIGGLLRGQKRGPVDPETVRVTFDDVAGIDEVEAEISEVVDFLKNPGKYRQLGARAPKGVLLTGPPGTGKTLLARATAGEAGVPFFSVSASEFIELIVGVGAQRVRELFSEARKVAPAIIFIDEIDTIGRSRGGPVSFGGHDEREQTLNQILTEMDGFTGSEGVIVMAATNRPDVLDPALLRPGRFDRQVVVQAPDAEGRAAILRIHTRTMPLADDVDLDAIAKATPGLTGADLANLANEAALLAARGGSATVNARAFADALEKVQLGTARKIVLSPEDRRRTAFHEAGHALLGILQPGADPVRRVSIIPRGRALGVTLSTPEMDRYGYDEGYLRGRVIGALGGMAAEELVFQVVTTGSENDLENATRIVRSMVGRWGMSEAIGPVSVLPAEGDPRLAGVSNGLLDAVDAEVRRVIEECYAAARQQLAEHRGQLTAIADRLLEEESLDEAQVYAAAGVPRHGVTSAPVATEVAASTSPSGADPVR